MIEFIDRFMSRVIMGTNCWGWVGGKNIHGYGQIALGGRTHGAYRVSYTLANGPIPKDSIIMHTCDNPGCVNPKHLRLGTQKENMQDMIKKGRRVKSNGEINGHSLLTADEVRQIRKEYATNGFTLNDLSKKYGVHRITIHNIVTFTTWKHICK